MIGGGPAAKQSTMLGEMSIWRLGILKSAFFYSSQQPNNHSTDWIKLDPNPEV